MRSSSTITESTACKQVESAASSHRAASEANASTLSISTEQLLRASSRQIRVWGSAIEVCLSQFTAVHAAMLSVGQMVAMGSRLRCIPPAAYIGFVKCNEIHAIRTSAVAASKKLEPQMMLWASMLGLSEQGAQPIDWLRVTGREVRSIPPCAMSCLTCEQLTHLSDTATAHLSANQLKHMDVKQIDALRHLDWLNPQATAGLTAEQVAQIPPERFAALRYPDWLGASAVSALTADHIAAISVHWGWMSDCWIAALHPDVMLALGASSLAQLTAHATSGFTADQIRRMQPSQIGALRHPQGLSISAVAALSGEQVQAIASSWFRVSDEWVGALRPEVMAQVNPEYLSQLMPQACSGLTIQQRLHMSAEQLQALL